MTRAKEREKDLTELLVWDVPAELKTKFKTKCAEKNVTMKDAIIELMTKFCK